MSDYALEIQEVGHSYGTHQVLKHVNLKVKHGQFVGLVGGSGCGKSTLFRAILGTHPPTEGIITAEGNPVTKPTRDVGIVYQHYSLYDFLTAKENVAFGPLLDQTNLPYRTFRPFAWKKLYKQMLEESEQLLAEFGLENAANNYPSGLSGGMKQRVAIAQAIIMHPKVLLLDEPFGALDEITRQDLQVMLLTLYQKNLEAKKEGKVPPYTVILVTHELNEAFYIADRVVGLSQHHGNDFKGATVTYDKPVPIFAPDAPRNFGIFFDQKEELKKVVFNEESKVVGNQFVDGV